jgi:hypothetical protein
MDQYYFLLCVHKGKQIARKALSTAGTMAGESAFQSFAVEWKKKYSKSSTTRREAHRGEFDPPVTETSNGR